MNTGIYAITNIVNGKMYVGSTTKLHKRWGQHKTELRFNRHFNPLLQNAWNKCGESSFSYRIVENCDVGKLLLKEEFWMRKLKSHKKFGGYNLCEKPMASRLGCKASPKTISKMSKSLSGKNHPMWGKHLKRATKRKLRELQIGIPKPNSGFKKRFVLMGPNGERTEIVGLRRFCRENDLPLSIMWRVVNGRKSEYNGWKLI